MKSIVPNPRYVPPDALELYKRLADALWKRRDESLLEAARRVLRQKRGYGPKLRACHFLLNSTLPPWQLLERTEQIMRGNSHEVTYCAECTKNGKPARLFPAVDGGLCALHASRRRKAQREAAA